MKKNYSVIFIFMAFILSLTCIGGLYKTKVFAEQFNENNYKSAYLIDANTGTVIFKKNENERLPIASMCKIMTLLLCFDAIENNELSLSEEIVVSANASKMGGSQIFLEENGRYIVEDLIKGIVVASANDACVAMAERLTGSEDNFVEKMNLKCKELEMNNTNFVNCTGLPKIGQYSTAKDVSIMFSHLIKHKDYFLYSKIWLDEILHPKGRVTEITNTNKLVKFYNGCDCGKTGYTSEAGFCLAASAMRNDMRLIAVIINANDSKTRFREVSSMFNYGFANYVNKLVVDNQTPLDILVNVSGGKKDKLNVVAKNSLYLFSKKNEKRIVEIEFSSNKKIFAPINKGDVVGKLSVYEKGVEIASIDVLANEDILEKTFFDNIVDISKNWSLVI